MKAIRLSPYSCKYSKKIYTRYQLLVLILFKDYRNQHYREFVEDIGDMESIQKELELSVVPHFTTLQKFFCRIKTLYLRYAFRKTTSLFYSNDDPIAITAVDSSGFTSGYSSHYYSARTGKIRKHFLKTSISVDTDTQAITGFITSKSRVHDTRHAARLLPQCHKIRRSECYVMDRGYDSEAIHRQVREELLADSIIPIRSWNNQIIGGKYRNEMAGEFDDTRYRRRQLVENKFSVLKRKFGGDLKARIFSIQRKEIAGKMIVCNIHKFLQFLVMEVFYRANLFNPPIRILAGESTADALDKKLKYCLKMLELDRETHLQGSYFIKIGEAERSGSTPFRYDRTIDGFFDHLYNNWRKQEILNWMTPASVYDNKTNFNKNRKCLASGHKLCQQNGH